MAEKPTSSSTMNKTFGAPSGALAGSNGDQSGSESRMSMLIVPRNGLVTLASVVGACRQCRFGSERRHHPVGVRSSPGALLRARRSNGAASFPGKKSAPGNAGRVPPTTRLDGLRESCPRQGQPDEPEHDLDSPRDGE